MSATSATGGRTGLRVEGLTVRFGDQVPPAVDDVDLAVPPGSVIALLGPSGCGKTTLVRAVAGLERPTSGRVLMDGVDLRRTPVHRRGFALMFQDGQLFEHLDVAANVAYPLRLGRGRPRLPRAHRRARVEELLTLVGLEGYAARSPATLSGGERQRVALARALAVDPRLLLLDEPLSALDRGLRERLARDLRDILTRARTTAVMVTHDHEEAFAVADRIAVVRAGRVVQQGPLADVWARPVDAWTAEFLGYAVVLDPERAGRLRARAAPRATWETVALRRSALRVDVDGPLEATVREVRPTPDQVRLRLDVDGLGELPGVAGPRSRVAPGDRVRLSLDAERVAPVGPAEGPRVGGGSRPGGAPPRS